MRWRLLQNQRAPLRLLDRPQQRATACTNLITVRRDGLEATVLEGLATRLMDPELFKVFVAEFTAEWNKLQADTSADQAASLSELARVRTQVDRLIDALADGMPPSSVKGKLIVLETRREKLEAELAVSQAPAPRLHPNLAEVYRQKVATLAEALMRGDGSEARELVRSLIDKIVLVPEEGSLQIEIRGELAKILTLASAGQAKAASADAEALAVQVKLVAGTRLRLYRTCFGWRRPRRENQTDYSLS